MVTESANGLYPEPLEYTGDSKLLSGFPWLIIFKPEITK
jgi:hypothetical protein